MSQLFQGISEIVRVLEKKKKNKDQMVRLSFKAWSNSVKPDLS